MKTKYLTTIAVLVCTSIMLYKYSAAVVDFENFAMGSDTSPCFASRNNYPIHTYKITNETFEGLYKGWQQSKSETTLLILGNSQAHGINQFKPEEYTYVYGLSKQDSTQYTICHSIPNASMQFFLLSASYLTDKIKIDKLLIPAFFDDYREDGIREIFYEKILTDRYLMDSTINPVVKDINDELKSYWSNNESQLNENTYISMLDISEPFLDSSFSAHSKIWSARADMRSHLFINLYQARNKIFNISAQTIRNKIPNRYDKNMECLKSILLLAKKKDIQVYVYIPPIRNDVQIPYDLYDYSSFKNEVSDLTDNFDNCYFTNLENLVPAKFWGMKASTKGTKELEYDFMHFQFKGHQLLDSALNKFITNQR